MKVSCLNWTFPNKYNISLLVFEIEATLSPPASFAHFILKRYL